MPEPDESRDWEAFAERARERMARRQARLEAAGRAYPSAGASFRERYQALIEDLEELCEDLPEIEVESHGPAGLRLRFAPTEREVRLTPLEEQRRAHFVFSHATLGTLHRAEHHASRPFGERRPDAPRLLRQILDFLIDGREPRWLNHPPPESPHTARDGSSGDETLELPLD